MTEIVQALSQHELLAWVWRAIVWAGAGYLLILGALIFVRPAIVHRFFNGFVSSRRVNFLEAGLRLIIGLAFMGASAETRAPIAFFWFGAVLAATAIPMMFLYEFHKRLAVRVIPFAKRILPLMGVVALGFGAAVLWAMG